jgi:hypothetical protein
MRPDLPAPITISATCGVAVVGLGHGRVMSSLSSPGGGIAAWMRDDVVVIKADGL